MEDGTGKKGLGVGKVACTCPIAIDILLFPIIWGLHAFMHGPCFGCHPNEGERKPFCCLYMPACHTHLPHCITPYAMPCGWLKSMPGHSSSAKHQLRFLLTSMIVSFRFVGWMHTTWAGVTPHTHAAVRLIWHI